MGKPWKCALCAMFGRDCFLKSDNGATESEFLHEARYQLLIDIRSSNEDYHPDGDMEAYILEYFALCVLCARKEPAIACVGQVVAAES